MVLCGNPGRWRRSTRSFCQTLTQLDIQHAPSQPTAEETAIHMPTGVSRCKDRGQSEIEVVEVASSDALDAMGLGLGLGRPSATDSSRCVCPVG